MKKFLILIVFIITLSALAGWGGVWVGIHTIEDEPMEKLCIRGEVAYTEFFDPLLGRTSFIGQQVICAENWIISPAFGPSLEFWLEKGMKFDSPAEDFGGLERVETKP